MWRKQLLAVIIAVTFFRYGIFWFVHSSGEHALARCTSNEWERKKLHKFYIRISRRIQMVFRFYTKKASRSRLLGLCVYIFILSGLRPLFPLCPGTYMHSFAHFVIVLFWFSRTNIPNVFWNVVLRWKRCCYVFVGVLLLWLLCTVWSSAFWWNSVKNGTSL